MSLRSCEWFCEALLSDGVRSGTDVRPSRIVTRNLESTISESPPNQSRRIPWSEGVLLAAIPAAGLACAFLFEIGYASVFQIPSYLVRVDFSHAMLAILTLAGVAGLLHLGLTVLPVRPWMLLAVLLMPPAIIATMLFRIATLTQWTLGFHLVVPIALISMGGVFAVGWFYYDVLAPALVKDSETTVWERWRVRWITIRGQEPFETISDRAWRDVGPSWSRVILAVMAVAFSTNALGKFRARTQSEFLYSASDSCVVVSRYSSTIVCAVVDTSAKKVLPEFKLLSEGSSDRALSRVVLLGLQVEQDEWRSLKLFAPLSSLTEKANTRP